MRRIFGVGLVVGLLAAGCSGDDDGGATATTQATGSITEGAATDGPTIGPLVSGTASIVDGTYAWTDYVYDDRGPDVDGEPGGDATHPDGWRNEADLVQLQLSAADGAVDVRAVLETLTDPTVPVVVLGLDTDGDPTTGTDQVGDDWSLDGAIGAEHWVVLHDEAVEVPVLTGALEADNVSVDAEANTIEAAIPLDPAGARWNVVAATATVPEEGGDPTLQLHDLAFVGDEGEYRWQDDTQSGVLAGEADATPAVAEIEFDALAEGDDLADATSPGFHTYLYASDLELGEGVAPAPEDGLEYRGPYQPYLVWIPDEGAEADQPMTVFLHGLTQNHLGSVISPDGAYLGTGRPLSEEIGNLEQYARDGLDFPPHNLTVWPLARGEGLGYRGIAEQDVLDVLADATERFQPDPDRIILSGGSMGGIGAFRLGALYPDRFSVVAPIIGLATEDTVPLLGNLANVPIRQINGAQDPLIPADAAAATTDALDALDRVGLEYRAWMLDQRGHEAGGFVYDCVYASLPEFERQTDPADVHYTVDPEQFVSDPASGLELSYDGAHWISGMAVADDSSRGWVEAHRIDGDGQSYSLRHLDRQGRSGPDGGDLCGPNPDVSTGDTWRERGVVREPTPVPPVAPAVEVELANLSAVTVDLTGAEVLRDVSEDLPTMNGFPSGIIVSSDGPAEVTLTGLAPGEAVTVAGDELSADDEGTLTYSVPAGDTVATLA